MTVKDCGHDTATYTVKVSIMKGWRRRLCLKCLTQWLNQHPALNKYAKVTITNYDN